MWCSVRVSVDKVAKPYCTMFLIVLCFSGAEKHIEAVLKGIQYQQAGT